MTDNRFKEKCILCNINYECSTKTHLCYSCNGHFFHDRRKAKREIIDNYQFTDIERNTRFNQLLEEYTVEYWIKQRGNDLT